MSHGKRKTTEQIINYLREAEVLSSQGLTVPAVCKRLGISNQSYYRYRKKYGGLKVN
jgi:predicted transcriptional regulator YheO